MTEREKSKRPKAVAKPKRPAANALLAAKKIKGDDERAAYLERQLARVDRPVKLVEKLLDALYAGSPTADQIGAKALALARAHRYDATFLATLGCELDDRYREDEAIEVLRKVVAAGSKNKKALETLGRLLLARGDDDAGVPLLERVIERYPEWSKPRITFAAWLLERDPARAMLVLGDVTTARALDLKAMITGASAPLRQALTQFDSEIEARKELSEWHFVENRFARCRVHAKALFELRQSVELVDYDVDDIDEAILQGYRLGGGFDELVPWLRERCKDVVPPNLAFDLFYGLTAQHPVPDLDLAIRAAEAAIKRESDNPDEARLWRVRIAGLRAREVDDVAALEALAHDGLDDNAAAWVELADAYRAVDLYDAAHAAVDRALQLDPDSAEALSTLFDLALGGGDLDAMHRSSEALAAAKPLWHQGPEHLGRSFARGLEPAPAVLNARKAVQIAPYCHNAWTALAEAQLVAGDLDAAHKAIARALALDAAMPGDDISVLRAAVVDRDPDALERALTLRFKHLPAVPFAAFVEKLRAAARAMP